MRVGIMQPYFFPYLGYFSLIAATDYWIVFDDIQYIRHGWINRNRILKPSHQDWQYINVPLQKHSRSAKISEVKLSANDKWKNRILGQIQHYKKIAPYYHETKDIIKQVLSVETDSIVQLNIVALKIVCEYLGISFKYQVYSQMPSVVDKVQHSGEWALRIAEQIEAKTYINPVNGKELFNLNDFEAANIDLAFLKYNIKEYQQANQEFIAGLSIIDVLMFNSISATTQLIKNYELLSKENI